MQHYERVCAYVDLDAIMANYTMVNNCINDKTKIIGVVKTDGYGHGAVAIAKEMEKVDFVWGYATATAEEAFVLRKAGMCKPILVLGYTFPYAYDEMIRLDIRPTVFREDSIEQWNQAAERVGKKVKVHIKVDTAMSRIGIMPDEDGINFIKELLKKENIEIEGIFTHFAKADEESLSAAEAQLERFDNFVKRAEEECNVIFQMKHCSNSAAALRMPEANMDAVRLGVVQYGLWPSEEMPKDGITLLPALSLKSHIVYIKKIKKGTQISYGGTFTAEKEMLIATIPVGYGDGYPRKLSNNGHVLIRGQKAPIVGRICMDQFMVDVSHIDGVLMGDVVTLIGKDGKEHITMEELGSLSGRFNYELACDLGKRIPKLYLKGNKIVATKDYHDDYMLNE